MEEGLVRKVARGLGSLLLVLETVRSQQKLSEKRGLMGDQRGTDESQWTKEEVRSDCGLNQSCGDEGESQLSS